MNVIQIWLEIDGQKPSFNSMVASGASDLVFDAPIEAFDIDVYGNLGPIWTKNYFLEE